MKSTRVAYTLWALGIFGCLGLHRFYLGKKWTGCLWLVSGGLLGIGAIIDFISLEEQVNYYNKLALLNKMAFRPIEVASTRELNEPHRKPEIVTNIGSDPIAPLPMAGLEAIYLPSGQKGGESPKPICPYCWTVLEHMPQRKTKCPFCRKQIYIRSKQTLFANCLLSKEDATAVDYLKFLEKFGVRESDYIREEMEIAKRLSEEISSTDVIWSLFQKTTVHLKDPEALLVLQTQMKRFLLEGIKDPYSILQRSAKIKLMILKERGARQVKIVTLDQDCCAVCRAYDGKSYGIDQALAEMPLPVKKCAHHLAEKNQGYCWCDYI